MEKIREHTNQMREKCVELHKSGNGYNKIASLKIPYLLLGQYLKPVLRWHG